MILIILAKAALQQLLMLIKLKFIEGLKAQELDQCLWQGLIYIKTKEPTKNLRELVKLQQAPMELETLVSFWRAMHK